MLQVGYECADIAKSNNQKCYRLEEDVYVIIFPCKGNVVARTKEEKSCKSNFREGKSENVGTTYQLSDDHN